MPGDNYRFYADFTGADPRRHQDMRDSPDSGPILHTLIFGDQPVAKDAYPDGNPKTAMGAKKPDLSVVPPAGILHMALAMMNGAEKYGPFNWRELSISSRPYIAAAMRHLQAYLDGEDYSQDTTEAGRPVHHLGHVMACCAILLDAESIGMLNDNRPSVRGKAGDMIESFNKSGSLRSQS